MVLLFSETVSTLGITLDPFLAHLSTTCSGGAIVTGHRPASVRMSVRPTIIVLLFSETFSTLGITLDPFLAHLSTTCSGGAIVTGHCPASVRLSVRLLTISLKIFSSKTRRPILIKLGRNFPWVKLYKNC